MDSYLGHFSDLLGQAADVAAASLAMVDTLVDCHVDSTNRSAECFLGCGCVACFDGGSAALDEGTNVSADILIARSTTNGLTDALL